MAGRRKQRIYLLLQNFLHFGFYSLATPSCEKSNRRTSKEQEDEVSANIEKDDETTIWNVRSRRQRKVACTIEKQNCMDLTKEDSFFIYIHVFTEFNE